VVETWVRFYALKTYVRVRESSGNAMRVRAWRETVCFKDMILGVTDECMQSAPGDWHGGRHAGQDGQGAAAHEREEMPLVDACPLHGARERGQRDLRKHAGRVQIEARGPVKVSLSHLGV